MGSVGSTNAKVCFSVTVSELPLADTWPLPAPENHWPYKIKLTFVYCL